MDLDSRCNRLARFAKKVAKSAKLRIITYMKSLVGTIENYGLKSEGWSGLRR